MFTPALTYLASTSDENHERREEAFDWTKQKAPSWLMHGRAIYLPAAQCARCWLGTEGHRGEKRDLQCQGQVNTQRIKGMGFFEVQSLTLGVNQCSLDPSLTVLGSRLVP